MDNAQKAQKFNNIASTFTVLGKAVEKLLVAEVTEEKPFLICELADMLIKEINELKNSFGCEVK